MRVALYSHDTYGLGHFRRCLKLAWALTGCLPQLEGVFLSGSPWTSAFPLPPRFRVVHLPPAIKVGSCRYAPRRHGGTIDDLVSRRTAEIRRVLANQRPDLFLVDNVPGGLHGEIRAALGSCGAERPTSILLLRDILDEPRVATREWHAAGAHEAIESFFEEVWCFGNADDVSELRDKGPLRGISKPVVACGHLGWTQTRARHRRSDRRERPQTSKSILVTTGGGGDGEPLVENCVRAARHLPEVSWRVVLGPDFPALAESRVRAEAPPRVHVERFVPDLDHRLFEVDLVVSMAGYNTVCEILASGCPALLMPREVPRREQLIRAERLAERDRAGLLRPEDLRPERLAARIETCLAEARHYPCEALPGGWIAAERARRLLRLEGQRKAG